MSSINGIGGQRYVAPQTNKTQTTAKQSSARATADYYVPGDAQAVQAEAKAVPFTEDMATVMAEKYDVQNMSRNDYTKLVAELRDSGVLTSQEYSIAYSGKLPSSEQKIAWPHGNETKDFSLFLRECKAQCNAYVSDFGKYISEKEMASAEELVATYSKLSEIFKQIGQEQTAPPAEETHEAELSHFEATSAVKEYSDEVMRLYELLKQDEEYIAKSEKTSSTYGWDCPIRDELFKELLLFDTALMEEFAMYSWGRDVEENLSFMESNASLPKHQQHPLNDVQATYEERINDYKHQLLYGGKDGIDAVYNDFQSYLRAKARYDRLTEVERLVCPEAAKTEKSAWCTFEERMEPVMDEVKNAFADAGLTFDSSKNYQFHLDISTFTFSVTGGTDEENALFASVLNTNPSGSGEFNPYKTTINAIQFSKPDDMSYTPWELNRRGSNFFSEFNAKFFNMEENLQKHGIANISAEYTEKMNQFNTAYRRDTMDDNLQRRFGFGIADFSFENGQWIGKTDEITKLIENMNKYGDWDKQIGDAYRDLMKEYSGTPTFEKPVFVFINGKLQLTYEEWE